MRERSVRKEQKNKDKRKRRKSKGRNSENDEQMMMAASVDEHGPKRSLQLPCTIKLCPQP